MKYRGTRKKPGQPRRTSLRKLSTHSREMVLQTDPQKLSSEDKRQAALELRIEGHAEQDIANALGVTQSRVSQMLREVLEDKRIAMEQMAPELRTMELERLDRLILAWFGPAKKDPRSADVLHKFIAQRHKILGIEITNVIGTNGALHMGASSIDLNKLGQHADGDRLLANLEEIMQLAGPQVDLPENQLPALEHRPQMKTVN